MKFLSVFFFFLVASFLFYSFLSGSVWMLIAKDALLFALPVYLYIRFEEKTEALEKRIKELEEKENT